MTNAEPQVRAEAVSRLWDFKRLCDSQESAGMPVVHFSMLLSDPVYRDGMLQKAQASADPRLVSLAGRIRAMNIDGPLKAAPNGAAALPSNGSAGGIVLGAGGAGGTAGGGGAGAKAAHWPLIAGIAVLAVAIIAGMLWRFAAEGESGTVVVSKPILSDTVWRTGTTYVLDAMVFVDGDARLTIEPGVTVRGRFGSALVVTRDASLHARGRADAPIVFTSDRPTGERRAGDWGGVVLLGNAPVNRDAHIEGIDRADPRGDFGGSDAASSCGVLDYLRIEFAGFEISQDNELNGLTLGGCGSGTIVRHVQVHRGLDDGIEVFGGTVDLQHIVISDAGDDAFDWDMGWTGRVQHLAIRMAADTGDNAFEGDNFNDDMNALPRSAPTFYNVTAVALPGGNSAHRGMTVRRGSGGRFHNMIFSGFRSELIDIRDAATAALVGTGALDFGGILAYASGSDGLTPFPDESDDDGGFSEARYFSAGRLQVVGREALAVEVSGDAAFSPVGRMRVARNPHPVPQGEFWDESADYFGAVRPGSTRSWLSGWTAFPAN